MLTYSDAFLFAIIIFVISLVVMIFKKTPIERIITTASFIAYMCAVSCITLFPIVFQEIGYDYEYNFIPLKGILEALKEKSIYGIYSVFGNIVMFVPFGAYMILLFKKNRIKAILCCLVCASSIELVQFLIGVIIGYQYRCVDIDDIILNMMGGVIGVLLFYLFKQQYLKRKCKTD